MPSSSEKTMMRELTAAADRERTGAFDVEWEGGRASLFFIFGHANHVELERPNGEKLVGNDALAAIARELPEEFEVSPWRRAMVTDDTLRCTAEELKFMFRRDHVKQGGRAAARSKDARDGDTGSVIFPGGEATGADEPAVAEEPATEEATTSAEGDTADAEAPVPAAESPDAGTEPGVADPGQPPVDATPEAGTAGAVAITLDSFPELPAGTILFSDEAANVDGLERAVPHLPNSIIVLTADATKGVVVIAAGSVLDALHVGPGGATTGEAAARAVFDAREGRLDAHAIEDSAVLEALPATWQPAPAPQLEPAEPEVQTAAQPESDADQADMDVAQPELEAEAQAVQPEPGVAVLDAPPSEVAEAPDEATVDEWGLDLSPEGSPLASPHEPAIFSLPDLPERATDSFGMATAAPEAPSAPPEPPAVEPATGVEAEAGVAEGDAELAAPPTDAGPVAVEQSVEPATPPALAELSSPTTEFVPTRVEVDMDALRAELVGIAEVWLGDADAAPVAAAIHAARPGVDDFVAAIQAIGSMEIAGHEHAVVRAMAREMHFRAAEVLCGV